MSLADDFEALKSSDPSPEARRGKGSYPKGWEPGIEYDEKGGFLTSIPRPVSDNDVDEKDLLSQFDLDPDKWSITNLRRSQWQRWDGEWLESYRATMVPKGFTTSDADLDEYLKRVVKYKPSKREKVTGDGAYFAPVGDTQFGKAEGGGTPAILDRFQSTTEQAIEEYKTLSKRLPLGTVVLPWLGDCIEGFNSQGGRHIWRTDLTMTQMVRVYRTALEWQIVQWAPLVEHLVIPVIPGNHDEAVRVGNTLATTFDDSWAIEGAMAVQAGLKHNPETFGHVQFIYPRPDELTVTIEAGGMIVGMAHGHQFGRDPMKWWAGQAHGRRAVGDADLLLGAHLHHLRVQHTGGGKTFIQTPTLDGGSSWFRHRNGEEAPPGMIGFTVVDGKWDNLRFFHP